MGWEKFLFDNFKSTQIKFEEASDILKLDFKKLCFKDPKNELHLTVNTQPALLLTSVSSFQVLEELTHKKPKFSLGHSIGEYSAVVSAKILSFADALKAVRHRGEAMQSAVPRGQGAMLAIMGLTPEQASKLCQWVEAESSFKPIEPANFNTPGQVVVSGNAKALHWLQNNFKKEIFSEQVLRVKFIPLKVSAPFHCSMMKPAEEKMKKFLFDQPFQQAEHPVIQNFTASMETDPNIIKNNLVRQISGPVRWIECMQIAKKHSIINFIECGPGKVLAGLAKKIHNEFKVYGMNNLEDLKILEQNFKES